MARVNAITLGLKFLLLAGLLVFSRGFLPPTRTQLGLATAEQPVPPQFSRLVFMVVDAMRSDFLFSAKSHMSEVHELLRQGRGYAFTAYSDPPTVTLPRLKGLTTGASPNFLDAVINIAESDTASTLHNQDSWVEQLYTRNKSLHMFGDDTWLKLFPDRFAEFEGTASFYVADFTEVDTNVTRHLDSQLNAGWDVLVLHYLGLDHIGHKGGPDSVHMPAKQAEMSQVVARIYDSLDNDTLLVVAGDHGMNDVGNHGGASAGETAAALLLLAKQFDHPLSAPAPTREDYAYYTKCLQIDLVPTLATLLGFPTPKNSLGAFISDLLPLWNSSDQAKILAASCAHLDVSQCSWDNVKTQQTTLMRASSEHVLPYMYGGIAVLGATALAALVAARSALNVGWLVLPVLYFIAMMGSSTVEEEHYLWYWVLSGVLTALALKSQSWAELTDVGVLFVAFRVMRGWNTAGQKWASLLDTADLINHHSVMKHAALVLSFLLAPGTRWTWRRPLPLLAMLAFTTFKLLSEFYPVGEPNMLLLARAGYAAAAVDLVWTREKDAGLVLVGLMQTKVENALLWLCFRYAKQALRRLHHARSKGDDSPNGELLALAAFCFEYAAFFSIGGSNSLASIDLSNAYNGVSGYNIPVVALLTYLGNWGPSLYFAGLNLSMSRKVLRAWFYGVALTGVTLACLILREHLFIWTVFSPKLLYSGAWLLFHETLGTELIALG